MKKIAGNGFPASRNYRAAAAAEPVVYPGYHPDNVITVSDSDMSGRRGAPGGCVGRSAANFALSQFIPEFLFFEIRHSTIFKEDWRGYKGCVSLYQFDVFRYSFITLKITQ
ncbi:hypothetical protein [Lonsdalea populi]|nr:hypothetical protein [Lonsdalea populi]